MYAGLHVSDLNLFISYVFGKIITYVICSNQTLQKVKKLGKKIQKKSTFTSRFTSKDNFFSTLISSFHIRYCMTGTAITRMLQPKAK